MMSLVEVIMMSFEVDGIWNHFWTIIFVVVLVAVSVGLSVLVWMMCFLFFLQSKLTA